MSIALEVRKRLTPAMLMVVLNYVGWRLGVYLNRFTGDTDVYGAQLCRTTYSLGFILAAVAVVYALVRKTILPKHQWDVYGPALAVFSVLLMWIESEMSVKY